MNFDLIPKMLAELPGFTMLGEYEQLSVTELAMAEAQAEYGRIVSERLPEAGTPIVNVFQWLFQNEGDECAVIGFADLCPTSSAPATFYLSAWKNGKMVALTAMTETGELTEILQKARDRLEYKLTREADRRGSYPFPMGFFSGDVDHSTYAYQLRMPAVELSCFTSPDDAREFMQKEQAKELMSTDLNISLLTKANANCDNVMGRAARNVSNMLADAAMLEQQAVSVARHKATEACQTMQAHKGKLASSWGSW